MITEVAVATESAITSGGITAFADWIGGLGSFADVLVALGSSGLLVVLYKVAGIIRYFKSPDFESHTVKLLEDLVDRYAKNPELIKSIASSASQVKEVQELLDKARDAKNDILLELEGRRIDIIAKIKSGLFEGDELTMLHEYLAKLEAKLNETPDKV
jgi:hypothetical protein